MSQRARSPLSPTIAFASVALFVVACGGSGVGNTAGTTGSAGTTGAAGTTGSAGSGGSIGSAGAAAGTTGAAGAQGGSTGTGGAAIAGASGGGGAQAGSTGAGGAAGAAQAGSTGTGGATLVDPSPGCNMAPGGTDSQTAWVKHDLTVTGVDPAWVSKYPVNAGQKYDWTHRNYFMRLPTSYNSAKPYPVTIGMSGCGGTETVGSEGGYAPLGFAPGETQAIQIALSYVLSSAASTDCGGAVFDDGFVNSPDPAYLESLVKDVEAKYCVDRSRLFLSGYSSGAFEAVTLGCTDSDILRGYGIQIGGGNRLTRPPCKKNPIAAMYVVGLQDTENPIGPLSAPLHDSLGSAPARDEVLTRNGCIGNGMAPWDANYPMCVKYTGCPDKYPVVWCAITSGHLPAMNDPAVGKYRYEGLWKFWSTLP
jgi:poly(3-hydroxybutyrate) depolymerase